MSHCEMTEEPTVKEHVSQQGVPGVFRCSGCLLHTLQLLCEPESLL